VEKKRTIAEINRKIEEGNVSVCTAEELPQLVEELGEEKAFEEVDAVTTATFGAMCSSGAFFNFGHTSPPMKMETVYLNGVPAYGGIAAVDAYLGATARRDMEYGGGHVIEDFAAGKEIHLEASGKATDCYPRDEVDMWISKETVGNAILFNPRNAYQNYPAATNSSQRTLYTYMGKLLPDMENATYATCGELSPLLNDPHLRSIGPGVKVLIAGAVGHVVSFGTQSAFDVPRMGRIPVRSGASLAVVGDLRDMDARYLRGYAITGYGCSLGVGLAVPIPVLDMQVLRDASVKNSDIWTELVDYSIRTEHRVLGRYTYQDLQSGEITLNGREIRTSGLSSMRLARELAVKLKDMISSSDFTLSARW